MLNASTGFVGRMSIWSKQLWDEKRTNLALKRKQDKIMPTCVSTDSPKAADKGFLALTFLKLFELWPKNLNFII